MSFWAWCYNQYLKGDPGGSDWSCWEEAQWRCKPSVPAAPVELCVCLPISVTPLPTPLPSPSSCWLLSSHFPVTVSFLSLPCLRWKSQAACSPHSVSTDLGGSREGWRKQKIAQQMFPDNFFFKCKLLMRRFILGPANVSRCLRRHVPA